jgi:hypothetical protein
MPISWNEINIEAAERMGELHDALKESNYTGHELEMCLVRLLFCLFADDSGIFDEKKLFYKYVKERTNEDGSDLALHLGQIFDILNTPSEKRLKNIDETINKFPYVDGGLFEERLHTAAFNSAIMNNYHIKINFAHQTFKWSNEARGKAAVYCVIIGFSLADRKKKISQYAAVTGEPMETTAKQINAYLIEGENIFITSRTKPLCGVPEMCFGNMPADGGELLFSKEEKEKFLEEEPYAEKYIKQFISAYEFLNNNERYCLWLAGIEPDELKKLKMVYERVKNVKEIRKKSARPFLAEVPHLFAQITQPAGKDYILIPSTSSETRKYIPMGFFTPDYIAANSCHIIPDGTLYHFGILTSTMHMAWTRYVCGRLEIRYRYSKDIVYNNFP